MKVLMVSWSWYPVGGDWTYIENMKRLYEENGMEVIPFSTKHGKNLPDENEKYFVTGYDYKELNQKKNFSSSIKALKNSVVSFEALHNIDHLLEEHDIAFAHLHIIHHWVTPAIIWKLKKRSIPIIWTLHEYKLICPEGSFTSNGKVCEKCFGGKFYSCAINKCKKQSFLGSSLASLDAYFYNFSNAYKHVDAFLCPSEFLLNKFKQFGFHPTKLKLTNLCYDVDAIDRFVEDDSNDKNYEVNDRFIFYVGRIEKLKGIQTLIEAVRETPIKLKLAGTGAALDEMKALVQQNGISNVEFLGFQDKATVYALTLKSLCVVCPSEWYENYPFSVIESLLLSKPVIGSRMGGIPELVIDAETGYLHDAGSAIQLREKMMALWNNPELAIAMGRNAREFVHSKVNFGTHWKIIEEIIADLSIRTKRSYVFEG
jgi:glycosyltransferase involved in cell wall biosynthesis